MRLHLVNPNTTSGMTEKIARTARAVLGAGVAVLATQPEMGPVSIEGFYDEAFAVPGMLGRIREAEQVGVDAHIIACFDDTGLEAARALADAPVIGIGEAAFHMASLLGHRFSVVTTLSRSIAAIEQNLHKYGLMARCARVRASEVAVLELEQPGSQAAQRISMEIARAKSEDRAEVIVLGCAGMTDLAAALAQTHAIPVLDGVACACVLAQGLAQLGCKTSKIGAYARPLPKPYLGAMTGFAPPH